jgi:myosin heavy subunit
MRTVAHELSADTTIPLAQRTALALRSLRELADHTERLGVDVLAAIRVALSANELHAATALGLAAALRGQRIPNELLQQLLPELESIHVAAGLLKACDDDQLLELVALLSKNPRSATVVENDTLQRARHEMQEARAEGIRLERQLREREQAFRELEARYTTLCEQAEATGARETVDKLKSEVDLLREERRTQRARIQELKATIREGAEQRRALRKQVAEVVTSQMTEREAPESVRDEPQDPEERLLEDAPEQMRQPLRHLIIAERANEQLSELPRDVATRALALSAALAAGQTHAFAGTKRLKRAHDVHAARIDLSHRLLFRVARAELRVEEVIDRRDLEQTIDHLRS